MPLKISEKNIQNAILAWLSWQKDCFAWPNQSVGIFDRSKGIYRRPVNRFHRNGVSDILGIWHGKMLCIEVKSSTGKLSKEQTDFIEVINNLGGIAFVARSVDDVKQALLK